MQPGDTFRCLQFQAGSPLLMPDFCRKAADPVRRRYLVGRKDGLTLLEFMPGAE